MNAIKIAASVVFVLFLSSLLAQASRTKVYFSPLGSCTKAIVQEVGMAKIEVYVQVYSFTSAPVARSLVEAKNRDVTVIAVLDKTNDKGAKYSSAKFLFDAGIPVYIDYKPAISHSKVIIIDQKTVITESFNFTKFAEKYIANITESRQYQG